MIISIKPLVFERLKHELVKLNIVELTENGDIRGKRDKSSRSRNHWNYDRSGEIDLASLSKKEARHLCELIETCGVHGTKILAADIKKYLKASSDGVNAIKARTARQATWMFEHYFKSLPHHTIFSKDEYGGNSHSGFYVSDVDYIPPRPASRGERTEPAHCDIDILHVENDHRQGDTIVLHDWDVCGLSCVEILQAQGYIPETPKLMEKLARETERYYAEREKIGQQYVASGLGLCDLDDITERKESYYRRHEKVKMDHFGTAKVVIDVLVENEDADKSSSRSSGGNVDPYRWHNWNLRFHTPDEDEIVRHLEADSETDEPLDVDIPVHPLVPCFDLRRHTRLRVHVNNLAPYQYDRKIANRLVLPERDWKMVNLLVDHSVNVFEDIVANKGQSMNVLAVGIPGTGKTATAEVFSEFKGRPLYTIQCAQLGLDAESVERNLSIIIRRANRWNAVLLLDEADVYIRKRSEDLTQNAIVGAFLRVLEYANCILFMTTNLVDSVDDAITSRCIAKLQYGVPNVDDQCRIWRILTDINNLEMTDDEIKKTATAHQNLSGRDVKNLLKLASFIAESDGKTLTKEMIDYAIQFKPTEMLK